MRSSTLLEGDLVYYSARPEDVGITITSSSPMMLIQMPWDTSKNDMVLVLYDGRLTITHLKFLEKV
ncbi:MAG: hypothetical protein EB119_04790 [Synechococcaceae bacterium WBB_34_004]|nr:hypothetical protein [Synechococcaceae bacterium WBB_34_004]